MGGDHWNRALDEVCSHVGAKSAAIQGDDESHQRRSLLGLSHFFRDDVPELPDRYMRGDDKGDEEAYRVFSSVPTNTLLPEYYLYGLGPDDQMPPSEFRSMLMDVGLATRAAAVVNRTGPWYDLFVLFFENKKLEAAALSHPDTPLILDLLSKTIELQRVMTSLRRRYSAALTALDHLGLGVVLANSNAEILLMNNEGQRILESGDGLTINSQRQLISNDDLDLQLRREIRAANTPSENIGVRAASPISVTRPSEAYDYLVSISPLSDSDAELEADLKAAFVLIVDPSRTGSLDAQGLTVLGKLTRSESDIANQLVAGNSVQQIAEARETSVLTVRSQIKSVSAKLRCKSQSDVIRLAALTRLPMIDT